MAADSASELEGDVGSDDDGRCVKVTPWLVAASQVFGWIYSITAFSIMISLMMSLAQASDGSGSCSYGVSKLFKPCLVNSFGTPIDDTNAFNIRIKSCSDPKPGKICLADFEMSAVAQQCTVGAQSLSALSGKGKCGCKVSTAGKSSDNDVTAAIVRNDPRFASQTNNAVFCYEYEIPDLLPGGLAMAATVFVLVFFVLHLLSLWFAIGEWNPPSLSIANAMARSEGRDVPDTEKGTTESGVEACPEELWSNYDRKAIVYNYNRDSFLVLFMYAFRCNLMELPYINVYYMVVEANMMVLGDYGTIKDLEEAQLTLGGLVVMFLKDMSLWLPTLFVALKMSDQMTFWWWIILLKGSSNLIFTTYYLATVLYATLSGFDPVKTEDKETKDKDAKQPGSEPEPPSRPPPPPPPPSAGEVGVHDAKMSAEMADMCAEFGQGPR